jgi:hypothetical protein
MKTIRRLAMAVTGLALAATAALADAAPHWSSDQVRAARPLGPVEALVFEARIEDARAGHRPEVVESVVTLAPTFTHKAYGDRQALDDYALCRTFGWGPALESHSCYAMPGFRMFELTNRQNLARVIPKIAPDTSYDLNPYWDEAELGVTAPDRLSTRRTDGGLEFRLGETVVVRTEGQAALLTPAEMTLVRRWLAHSALLHPQVRREIASGVALPGHIQSDIRAAKDLRRQTITISKVRRAQVAYPLPPGLASALRTQEGARPQDQAVAAALKALDGRPAKPKPSLKTLLDAMGAASRAGRHTEATLLFFNFTQQYASALNGPDRAVVLAQIQAALRAGANDPTVSRYMEANRLAGNSKEPGDRQAAARFLAEATALDALPFGTFRRLTYANLVAGSGDTSKWDPATRAGMPEWLSDNYWIHIAAYPWSANAYSDVGYFHLGQFDPMTAWLAFDLGRSIDPDWRNGAMGNVEGLEGEIRRRAPDFF